MLVLWRLKKWNVNFYVSFVLIFLVYFQITSAVGERPVLFTILFTPLIFIILEEFKDRVAVQKEKSWAVLFFLFPVMLLWSNLHGGFIIGNFIILVYMLCEGIKIGLKKATYNKREIIVFYIALSLAFLASCINPTGWEAFSVAFSPKYSILTSGIQEYHSPISAYISRVSPFPYGYAAMTFIFLFILILRNKKLDLTHVALLVGFCVMAATAGRFVIYYILIAAMIIGKETDILSRDLFDRLSNNLRNRMEYAFAIVALLSSVIFFASIYKTRELKLDIARWHTTPVSAVDFIEKNRLQGNMLNEAGYGGYITWRLYPWKRTFIDTRWLSATTQAEHLWMMNAVETIVNKELPEGKTPLWKRLLDHYNINFILFDILDVYGTVPRLLLKLADNENWVPIYGDHVAIIFIRDIPQNHEIIAKYRLSKDYVYDVIVFVASYKATIYKSNPKYLITLGKTFYEMGKLRDALTAYKYALKRHPKDLDVKEMIAKIEGEIESIKK
ncbi:MAG: hypothetical protein A2X54_03490 [Nitrospirae bacterium GWF2_44_13]|nr:MAG: hypothetical protein A2X54_03490 [Nitrospirae bacterium GWF2_44_13]OGW64782.1 MAG: hypothetical protein A2222_03550 [Nitrospirae bacterium RIFOXYA2_FULL_44_9]